jgi:hypothetical protein
MAATLTAQARCDASKTRSNECGSGGAGGPSRIFGQPQDRCETNISTPGTRMRLQAEVAQKDRINSDAKNRPKLISVKRPNTQRSAH